MEKFRDMEIIYHNERRSAFVCFNMGDLGAKFKVYSVHDGIKRYEQSFAFPLDAQKYADQIF